MNLHKKTPEQNQQKHRHAGEISRSSTLHAPTLSLSRSQLIALAFSLSLSLPFAVSRDRLSDFLGIQTSEKIPHEPKVGSFDAHAHGASNGASALVARCAPHATAAPSRGGTGAHGERGRKTTGWGGRAGWARSRSRGSFPKRIRGNRSAIDAALHGASNGGDGVARGRRVRTRQAIQSRASRPRRKKEKTNQQSRKK